MARFIYFSLSFIFFLLVTLTVNAQTADVKDQIPDIRAEKYYSIEGYQKAIDIYEKEDPAKMSRETQLKVANAYRLNGNSVMAAKYYALCINESSKPQDVYNYAQVLLSNGKCHESIPYFNTYMRSAGEKSMNNVISSCDELERFPVNNYVDITIAEGLNSKWLDFAPVFYKNGLIFTSGRPNNLNTKNKDYWSGKPFMDVYYAEAQGNGKFETPGLLSKTLSTKYHDGAATFTPDGNEMYYSSNNRSGKSKKGIKDLKIYTAKLINGSWTNSDAFPFNSDDYDNCHPALSADGNILVFASDMPGGQGGMDLYVSFRKKNIWSRPVNLGKQINTPGNELFPFIDARGTLYFSSDGQKGMGGLDIFSAAMEKSETIWSTPVNMGRPFNSLKDDLSFIVSTSGLDGYFASNREGGMGEDDIYYWTNKPDYRPNQGLLAIKVLDTETNMPVGDARVNLFDEHSQSTGYLTNQDGLIGKDLSRRDVKFIEYKKDGYETGLKYLSDDMPSKPQYTIIYMKPEKGQLISGLVTDKSTGRPLPGAEVFVSGMPNGPFKSVITAPDGTYSIKVPCVGEYKLAATKQDYVKSERNLMADEIPCNVSNAVVRDFALSPYMMNDKRRELSASFLGDKDAMFEAGKTFEVKDIYYDYNKSNIRKDAAKVLDKLVDLLREFPEMEIELSSHTDSRGTDGYNQKLSQSRADSAVRYLESKGISSSRMRSAGYGERVLKNDCADGVNCNEAQHQENRRTEIKILKL